MLGPIQLLLFFSFFLSPRLAGSFFLPDLCVVKTFACSLSGKGVDCGFLGCCYCICSSGSRRPQSSRSIPRSGRPRYAPFVWVRPASVYLPPPRCVSTSHFLTFIALQILPFPVSCERCRSRPATPASFFLRSYFWTVGEQDPVFRFFVRFSGVAWSSYCAPMATCAGFSGMIFPCVLFCNSVVLTSFDLFLKLPSTTFLIPIPSRSSYIRLVLVVEASLAGISAPLSGINPLRLGVGVGTIHWGAPALSPSFKFFRVFPRHRVSHRQSLFSFSRSLAFLRKMETSCRFFRRRTILSLWQSVLPLYWTPYLPSPKTSECSPKFSPVLGPRLINAPPRIQPRFASLF